MKLRTLPVKRRPAPKGIFKRLTAVTNQRKQRVAAAAATSAETEADDGSSKISRALTIVFLIHIVAIGLIFVHQKFLDGRTPETAQSGSNAKEETVAVAAIPPRLDLPVLTSGEKPYIVRQGDNYARIATAVGVHEGDLRLINKHVEIVPGLLLKIPPPRPVAELEPVAAAAPAAIDPNSGLVDAVDVSDAPRAKLVRPNTQPDAASVTASGKTYVVKAGDSVWRIANRFKVNQDALMKANGIADARKIKVGMNMIIPQ